jgi:hypothetical protein
VVFYCIGTSAGFTDFSVYPRFLVVVMIFSAVTATNKLIRLMTRKARKSAARSPELGVFYNLLLECGVQEKKSSHQVEGQ